MFWILFLAISTLIFGGAYALHWYLQLQEKKRKEGLETLLGVPQRYQWDKNLIDNRVDQYEAQKEIFEDEYADANKIPDNVELPSNWLSTLSADKKDMLKVRLMERAMGWVVVYRELEKDLKSNYPLYRKGVISGDYWLSIKDAEEILEKQFESIKKEASLIEPKQDPTTIFKEAVMMVDKYNINLNSPTPGPPNPAAKAKAGGAPPGAPPPNKPMPIQRHYTDDNTYAIQQDENEAELTIYVPNTTKANQVKIELKSNLIMMHLMGQPFFSRGLHKVAEIKPDPNPTWTLEKKNEFEIGDIVDLQNLTMKKLNGGQGKVIKPDKDTSKERVRIELIKPDKGRVLSIKYENLKNTNTNKRAAVKVTLEKAKESAIWPMPPWTMDATS